ncbi:MAG: DivIVA domain-containing protein [Gemmatimonadota bacterium]|uniref:DivIVA domain-containing protein n=1 Tax=Candidatus Palauibacter scopulicola TaxID=3056741 RepID=UPI00239FA014|nr:DivIVA domain-containing protein [Candidatus Palauibacter scopulicola]MDE2661548.1 DivIVA domain-containing protein [Candidatus Palauibacter scopulicola]
MIDLTPLDVRKKKDDFRRSVRGYDAQQVDAFLAVVADCLERHVREHVVLSDRIEQQKHQLESYRARERALNEALLAAQELREEARLQSERDATVRVREAEMRAEAVLSDAERAVRLCHDKVEDLKATRGRFLASLRKLFERFEEYLDFEDERFGDGASDVDRFIERLRGMSGGSEPVEPTRDGAPAAAGDASPPPPSISRVDVGGSGAAST